MICFFSFVHSFVMIFYLVIFSFWAFIWFTQMFVISLTLIMMATQFPGPSSPGMTLHRPSWVRINRLRTGVGLFRSTMHKWVVPSANCRCGAEEQTADYIITSCFLYHPPNGTFGLVALDDDTADWLRTTELCIRWINRPKRRRRVLANLIEYTL